MPEDRPGPDDGDVEPVGGGRPAEALCAHLGAAVRLHRTQRGVLGDGIRGRDAEHRRRRREDELADLGARGTRPAGSCVPLTFTLSNSSRSLASGCWATLWKTTSMPAHASATAVASRMSPCTNSTPGGCHRGRQPGRSSERRSPAPGAVDEDRPEVATAARDERPLTSDPSPGRGTSGCCVASRRRAPRRDGSRAPVAPVRCCRRWCGSSPTARACWASTGCAAAGRRRPPPATVLEHAGQRGCTRRVDGTGPRRRAPACTVVEDLDHAVGLGVGDPVGPARCGFVRGPGRGPGQVAGVHHRAPVAPVPHIGNEPRRTIVKNSSAVAAGARRRTTEAHDDGLERPLAPARVTSTLRLHLRLPVAQVRVVRGDPRRSDRPVRGVEPERRVRRHVHDAPDAGAGPRRGARAVPPTFTSKNSRTRFEGGSPTRRGTHQPRRRPRAAGQCRRVPDVTGDRLDARTSAASSRPRQRRTRPRAPRPVREQRAHECLPQPSRSACHHGQLRGRRSAQDGVLMRSLTTKAAGRRAMGRSTQGRSQARRCTNPMHASRGRSSSGGEELVAVPGRDRHDRALGVHPRSVGKQRRVVHPQVVERPTRDRTSRRRCASRRSPMPTGREQVDRHQRDPVRWRVTRSHRSAAAR